MPTSTTTRARTRRPPLRSPLAAPGGSRLTTRTGPPPDRSGTHAVALPEPRAVTLAEFGEYLRTVNNREAARMKPGRSTLT
jgi:hypothetical protein